MKNEFDPSSKVKVIRTMTTASGTLYKDQIASISSIDETRGKITILDEVGKIWHVKKTDIRKI